MPLPVFIAVISAAILHATWNALVKGGADKRMAMGAVVLGHMPFAIAALFFVPFPALSALPYMFAGMTLHACYQLFLLRSYEIGDLTQVYPIARGSAPLIVGFISVALLGVRLNPLELVAILIIGVGIISLTLVRRADGQHNGKAALFALATGCFIAAYSLVDGIGARIAQTSLGFYAWVAIGNGIIMAIYLSLTTPETLSKIAGRGRKLFFLGGGASFVAYALVTWAFTQAPIALVTALRETSIIFALLIGVVFLKERLDLAKVFSTMTTILGAALLRWAKS